MEHPVVHTSWIDLKELGWGGEPISKAYIVIHLYYILEMTVIEWRTG